MLGHMKCGALHRFGSDPAPSSRGSRRRDAKAAFTNSAPSRRRKTRPRSSRCHRSQLLRHLEGGAAGLSLDLVTFGEFEQLKEAVLFIGNGLPSRFEVGMTIEDLRKPSVVFSLQPASFRSFGRVGRGQQRLDRKKIGRLDGIRDAGADLVLPLPVRREGAGDGEEGGAEDEQRLPGATAVTHRIPEYKLML